MPVMEHPGHARGRVLVDAAGAPIASFEHRDRDGTPLADRLELADGVSADRAVAAVMAELRGWRVSSAEELGRLLVAAGAAPRRHSHAMSRDLTRDPAPSGWLEPQLPAGVRLAPVDRPATALADAYAAAFPPGHPDHDELPDDPARELDDLMSGRMMGPLLRCSVLAVGEAGDVVGAIFVNGQAGDPPFEGPWISNVFRRPEARGVGGALLKRSLALATRDGLPAVGLAVTHANPARSLYAAHGFADVLVAFAVEIP
jgi:GNAT superfamily N-acetyltransferase